MNKNESIAREYQLYEGRQRLGSYVHAGRAEYWAFDYLNRPLGKFQRRENGLAAIRGARSDCT